jgi:hypothetical protein
VGVNLYRRKLSTSQEEKKKDITMETHVVATIQLPAVGRVGM